MNARVTVREAYTAFRDEKYKDLTRTYGSNVETNIWANFKQKLYTFRLDLDCISSARYHLIFLWYVKGI